MLNVGVVGVGKMGGSHLSMINAHPKVRVVAACDTTEYLLDVLGKYTGIPTYSNYEAMLSITDLDAVIIATSTATHASMIEAALHRRLHVFCEKPLCLEPVDSLRLTSMAEQLGRVTQVGYHNRYVGAFAEVKRLVDVGAIGRVTNALAEAYGPVVLRPKGGTWRSRRTEGGGCLYDYAAHPIDLLTWYLGEPVGVGGTILTSIFSKTTDDAVSSTVYFDGGVGAQLSVNWSDESHRKMSTKITLWGTQGRIVADRQEVQVYLRDTAVPPPGYQTGWNVKYTTELTEPVWFYLRGEEYSAQLDDFVRRVEQGESTGVNTFASASVTDQVIDMLLRDADSGPRTTGPDTTHPDHGPSPRVSNRQQAWRYQARQRLVRARQAWARWRGTKRGGL